MGALSAAEHASPISPTAHEPSPIRRGPHIGASLRLLALRARTRLSADGPLAASRVRDVLNACVQGRVSWNEYHRRAAQGGRQLRDAFCWVRFIILFSHSASVLTFALCALCVQTANGTSATSPTRTRRGCAASTRRMDSSPQVSITTQNAHTRRRRLQTHPHTRGAVQCRMRLATARLIICTIGLPTTSLPTISNNQLTSRPVTHVTIRPISLTSTHSAPSRLFSSTIPHHNRSSSSSHSLPCTRRCKRQMSYSLASTPSAAPPTFHRAHGSIGPM